MIPRKATGKVVVKAGRPITQIRLAIHNEPLPQKDDDMLITSDILSAVFPNIITTIKVLMWKRALTREVTTAFLLRVVTMTRCLLPGAFVAVRALTCRYDYTHSAFKMH